MQIPNIPENKLNIKPDCACRIFASVAKYGDFSPLSHTSTGASGKSSILLLLITISNGRFFLHAGKCMLHAGMLGILTLHVKWHWNGLMIISSVTNPVFITFSYFNRGIKVLNQTRWALGLQPDTLFYLCRTHIMALTAVHKSTRVHNQM